MPSAYTQRSLAVLLLFGTLAALMAVLASILIFQLQAGRARAGPPSAVSERVAGVLLPVSAVLAALCLVLNVSCLLLCLLHSYFSAEACRGAAEPDRADWFLLDSRMIRHVAIGLFCCGVSVYLAALSIYMLLLFEIETGITSACILSSGIIVLLITVMHAFVRASQASRRSQSELCRTLYENDSARRSDTPASDLNNSKNVAAARPRPEIHREFSYPPYIEQKPHLASPARGSFTLPGSHRPLAEKDCCNLPRTHRTLSAEPGLLQVQGKPWNSVTQEMRNILSRKPAASGKDSTLV
ncbi:transmembrane protein 221 [Mauremys mutica]|uniref:transmembrane protein 221 n=1 Tax=Mauremys reevesii TaxID=260615 RepID=UPI00193F267F|nr:transmembrane protein 221 [Mauremys reevesii]XP_044854672.1 transmembrane protein 221 [Mauremys mutica]